jgi:hypothetical protein
MIARAHYCRAEGCLAMAAFGYAQLPWPGATVAGALARYFASMRWFCRQHRALGEAQIAPAETPAAPQAAPKIEPALAKQPAAQGALL